MKKLLSRIEILVIAVFFLIFIFWAGAKCNATKEKLKEAALVEALEDSLAALNQATGSNPEVATTAEALEEALRKKREELAGARPDSAAAETPVAPTTTGEPPQPAYNTLYITIDKLKLRSAPGLQSQVIGELPLFSEVFFLNEVTDSTFEISLGKEIANEPYVKVKTRRGTVGWVYGAGVNYYKKKREGVLE